MHDRMLKIAVAVELEDRLAGSALLRRCDPMTCVVERERERAQLVGWCAIEEKMDPGVSGSSSWLAGLASNTDTGSGAAQRSAEYLRA